jgi:hypothetical protein
VLGCALVLATITVAVGGGFVPAPARPTASRVPRPPLPARCRDWTPALARADHALAGRYWLQNHPVVTIGLDPTWREDPLTDRNWQFVFHSLPTVSSLLEAWAATGSLAYHTRATALLRDWIADNPRSTTSRWAWNDHSTALRSLVLACAAPYYRGAVWLRAALDLHGRTLADPAFYVRHGNHALDQSIGLLEVGHILGRADWKALARDRMAALVVESVDTQGVTNEQAVAYQAYNRNRYLLARERLVAMGMAVPAAFSRVDLMAGFLGHASLPNGTLERLGDSDLMFTPNVAGTISEFVATRGASGPKPSTTFAVYKAGFLFGRSGWGEARPFGDEVFWSQRFGPGRFIHGHDDGGAITLYGYGSRLLLDAGRLSYNIDAWRSYFVGRSAHNVVTVDGATWSSAVPTSLLGTQATGGALHSATQTVNGFPGVTHRRSVTFSKALHYLLVDDRLTASAARTFRQLWHLSETSNPVLDASGFVTRHARGNLLARQLLPIASQRIVKGATSPIQGWLSYRTNERLAAPVVEAVKSGTAARYLTLLVPAAGAPAAQVSGLTLTATGFAVTVTVGSRSERVVVDGTTATITALP